MHPCVYILCELGVLVLGNVLRFDIFCAYLHISINLTNSHLYEWIIMQNDKWCYMSHLTPNMLSNVQPNGVNNVLCILLSILDAYGCVGVINIGLKVWSPKFYYILWQNQVYMALTSGVELVTTIATQISTLHSYLEQVCFNRKLETWGCNLSLPICIRGVSCIH